MLRRIKKNWIYSLLLLSVISAILALINSAFFFKSGTAGIGLLIAIILNFKYENLKKDAWLIVGAFLFSILGDWYMSSKGDDAMMFVKGIVLFFLAHLFYMWFAVVNGKIKRNFTVILLLAFSVFFFLVLYPSINEKGLMIAALIYLVVSCLSMGAAVGIKGNPVFKWAYVFGIFLILFSDTIISFTEFVGYDKLDFLILPTYYLAHISITFALINRSQFENSREI